MLDNSLSITEDSSAHGQAGELSVVLSREETLVILHLLDLSSIPGLGEEPIPDLSAEQQAIALIAAERALRARGLAVLDPERGLRVHRGILQMVATCATASHSIHITQMLAPRGDTVQLIAHQGEEGWALHVRPEPVLHLFQWLKDWESVLEQIISFGRWPAEAARDDFTLTVTHETLRKVRDLSEQGEVEPANELLLAEGNDSHATRRLTALLSQPHRVTVAQWVRLRADQTVAIQSITILDREHELLVAVEPAQTPEPSRKSAVIKAISLEDLKQVFHERLQG